ncbi:MAG: NAD(+)/NADH kinase [Chloroflexi bacterium]|nr:MAG: NAD(+)/NADH kinase [Chloroflexota bacterium]
MADAVGLVLHPQIDAELPVIREARTLLQDEGLRVWVHCARRDVEDALPESLAQARLLISIGGDGTLLWTARQAAIHRVPVLGINNGRLGFLVPIPMNQLHSAIERWLRGDFQAQGRTLLRAVVDGKGEERLALNDVVVHKSTITFNLIRIELEVDGRRAGAFDADGAVVATSTGSTGYSLSLGGPILRPDVQDLVFTPLNPHSLFNRPVVLPQTARISLGVPREPAVLTCDGQVTVALEAGSRVAIEVAPVRAELVRFQPEIDFFDLLRSKLRWGLPLIDGD